MEATVGRVAVTKINWSEPLFFNYLKQKPSQIMSCDVHLIWFWLGGRKKNKKNKLKLICRKVGG